MKRILALICTIMTVLTVCPVLAHAADSGYPFTVEVVPPEGSIDYMGYYHIQGTPGETITLQANITNIYEKAVEIKAVPLNAYSGPDGIFYQSPGEVNAQAYSLVDEAYGLAQYISAEGPFILQPGQTKTAEIVINVPDIDTGTLLGSIRFVYFAGTQEMQNPSGQSSKSTILIDKYQAVDTAIQIDLSGQAQPSLAAGTPSLTEDEESLLVPVLNQSALIEENVSVEYEIRDSQGGTLFQGAVGSPKMAPMTGFNALIPLGGIVLGSGDYTLYAKMDSNGEEAVFTEPFTVENAKPAVLDNSPPMQPARADAETQPRNAPQHSIQLWLLAGFIAVILCFGVCIRMTYKRHKQPEGYRQAYKHGRHRAI